MLPLRELPIKVRESRTSMGVGGRGEAAGRVQLASCGFHTMLI